MFEAEVVHEFAGYVCRYTPTIMDGPVFRFEPKAIPRGRFEVSASRHGIVLSGSSPTLKPTAAFDLVQVIDLCGSVCVWLAESREDTAYVKAKIKAAKEVT